MGIICEQFNWKELKMSRLKKLTAVFITLIFSQAAAAVIVDGPSVSKAIDLYSSTSTAETLVGQYDVNSASYASAPLTIATQTLASPGSSLIPNLPVLPALDVYDNVVSYAGLESLGVASRADYHGWMAVNLSPTKADAEETVTVPEPSSLLLLVGPFLFLLWRMDVLPKFFRRVC
jgi:hypothetical protein